MKKYKIDNYIVTANSLHDAVSIVRQIKDAYSNGIILEKHETYKGPNGQFTVVKVRRDNGRIQYVVTSDKRDIDAGDKMPSGTIENDLASAIKTAKEYASARRRNSDATKDSVTGREVIDSVKDSRRINYDDDIIEVTLNGKVVFRGYAEDWLDDNFDSNFKWTGSQYEASNAKGKWVVRVIDSFRDARTISPWALSPGKRILSEDGDKATVVSVKGDRRNGYDVVVKFDDGSTDKWYYMPDDVITVIDSGKKIGTMTDTVEKTGDSFQKDSLTVRDVIQSLINEETSAISSYNVALETLKDHIPNEAYAAIKAIRDDEQRHVENLYAVLNGNVTPKNLEN